MHHTNGYAQHVMKSFINMEMAVHYVNFVNVGAQLQFQTAGFRDKQLNIINSYTQILSEGLSMPYQVCIYSCFWVILLSYRNLIVSVDTTISSSSKASLYIVNLPFRPPPQMLLPPPPTINNSQHHSFTTSSNPYIPASLSFPAHTFSQPPPTQSCFPVPVSLDTLYSSCIPTNQTNNCYSLKVVPTGSHIRKYFLYMISKFFFILFWTHAATYALETDNIWYRISKPKS